MWLNREWGSKERKENSKHTAGNQIKWNQIKHTIDQPTKGGDLEGNAKAKEQRTLGEPNEKTTSVHWKNRWKLLKIKQS